MRKLALTVSVSPRAPVEEEATDEFSEGFKTPTGQEYKIPTPTTCPPAPLLVGGASNEEKSCCSVAEEDFLFACSQRKWSAEAALENIRRLELRILEYRRRMLEARRMIGALP